MYLLLTADNRFWKTERPVLLLGEWCKTYDNQRMWQEVPHELIPYHWDNRSKLYRDYVYLDQLSERLLYQLSRNLNELHRVDRSVRYWRIIVGPWLWLFVSNIFDRYECLRVAAASQKVASTLVGKYDPSQWLLPDILPFLRWIGDNDVYNQYLFTRIIQTVGIVPYEVVNLKISPPTHASTRVSTPWRSYVQSLMMKTTAYAARRVPKRLKRVFFITSSLTPVDQFKLELALGQIPTWDLPYFQVPQKSFDPKLRLKIAFADPETDFEPLIYSLIREECPSVYLENYHSTRQVALSSYPAQPSVIFTSNSYESNEGFKFWAAECVEKGSKLLGTQHGCHYGTALWMDTEDHQRRISDRFYSWGWSDHRDGTVVPLAAAKFNRTRRVRPRQDGRIMFATYVWPRYAYRMYSVPVASSGMRTYLESQFRFVAALPPYIQNELLVRIKYPNDRGWRQLQRWSEMFPNIRCYTGPVRFLDQLGQCRLFVGLTASTTHLEAFVADMPSVLFWNPAHFELRDEARPYFDALKEAGIVHDTPEAAARKIQEIFHDTLSWWRQPQIQHVRAEFCRHFAATSGSWKREWKKELLSMCNGTNINAANG